MRLLHMMTASHELFQDTIIKQGDSGDEFYVIRHGEASVHARASAWVLPRGGPGEAPGTEWS